MNNSEKLLKMLSSLIETGVLTSQDIAKGLLTSVKFNREKFASKLDLVTRELSKSWVKLTELITTGSYQTIDISVFAVERVLNSSARPEPYVL